MQSLRLLLLIIVLTVVTGCAGQATRSSMPWQSSKAYLYVTPVSPGIYKLDEFNTTHQGLKQILISNIAMGAKPEIVIYAPLKKNYQQQAQIARLAEDLGLSVYRYGPFGHLDIDSQTLLELAGIEPDSTSD